jgi:hypothetical protein
MVLCARQLGVVWLQCIDASNASEHCQLLLLMVPVETHVRLVLLPCIGGS